MVRSGTAGSGNGLMVSPHDSQVLSMIPHMLEQRTYSTVSSVITSCRTAARSDDHFHQHARVNPQSSETVVLIKHFPSEGVEAIAAYFMKDNIFRELPPIPPLSRGIPSGAACVSLDGGKVYVLGGLMEHDSTLDDRGPRPGRSVYVIDLGGEIQWTRCANMWASREKFGCGAMNGKIYVFGGINGEFCVIGSEVYNPMEDAWVRIKPMQYLGNNHQVHRLDEELIVYGGMIYHDLDSEGRVMPKVIDSAVFALDNAAIGFILAKPADTWEAYHPGRDEWRVIPHLDPDESLKVLFMAKGKLHGMCPAGIWVYDTATNAWTRKHFNMFPDLPSHGVQFIYTVPFPFAVKAVGDELLAVVNWQRSQEMRESRLVRSTGFGRENEIIVWRDVQATLCFPNNMDDLYHTQLYINHIQLSMDVDELIPTGNRVMF